MFKWLFIHWTNQSLTPSTQIKINLWSFLNIRTFRLKISNMISYLILSLSNLSFKNINIYYKNISFEYIYIQLVVFFIFVIIVLFI